MIYEDPCYGAHEMPRFVEKLIKTKLVQRLRGIAQANAPRGLFPRGVPTRFEHSMGVCLLAMRVLENNPEFANYKALLLSGALLHDAGSPAFSHLGEVFLERICGKGAEEFLEDAMDRFGASEILREFGIGQKQVVDFVCGRMKPLSDVLNNSMDIDNLDNVYRFNEEARVGGVKFDPRFIASSLRLHNGKWALLKKALPEAKKWQRCRIAVYNAVYQDPFAPVTAMLRRAMELAFYEGELAKDFFFLTDADALLRLHEKSNQKSRRLVEMLLAGRLYQEVIGIEYLEISGKFRAFLNSFEQKKTLADAISKNLGLPEESVCLLAGGGEGVRQLTLPILEGLELKEQRDYFPLPVYKVKVFVPPDAKVHLPAIYEIISGELG